MDMDGVSERKKHIARDVERMRDRYLERDRKYLGIIERDLGVYREKHLYE